MRKGEKGTTAIFYKTLEKEDEQGETTKIPMLKTFTVFNVQQIDGLPLGATELEISPIAEPTTFDSFPRVEALIQQCGAMITERGQAAYFQPSTDEIVLPERHLFNDVANFYATALHELTHWTGGKKRLNRDMKGTFGNASYAFEELIAELGSAFLMADFGVVGDVQHESYIASWLSALKNDKRFIFKAASSASKAHQFLMALYFGHCCKNLEVINSSSLFAEGVTHEPIQRPEFSARHHPLGGTLVLQIWHQLS